MPTRARSAVRHRNGADLVVEHQVSVVLQQDLLRHRSAVTLTIASHPRIPEGPAGPTEHPPLPVAPSDAPLSGVPWPEPESSPTSPELEAEPFPEPPPELPLPAPPPPELLPRPELLAPELLLPVELLADPVLDPAPELELDDPPEL